MKNDANAPSTPATTTSIAMMPMLMARDIGESFWPKHRTGGDRARRRQEQKGEEGLAFHSPLIFRWNAAPYTLRAAPLASDPTLASA